MSYMILTWFVAIDHCLASARDPHICWAQLPAPSSYAAAPSHHGIHQTRFVHERRYVPFVCSSVHSTNVWSAGRDVPALCLICA